MWIPLTLLLAQAPAADTLSQLVWPAEHPEAVLGEDLAYTLRRQTVGIDYGLLFPTTLGGEKAFRLELSPDLTVTVDFVSREEAPGGFCWLGTLREDDHGSAIFSVVEDKVTASVIFQDRLFRISCAGAGLHFVSELDASAFPDCATSASHAVGLPGPGSGTRSSSNPDIDILVAYTTKASNNQGGTNAMESLINLAITETNQAYQNSDTTQRLVLVHSQVETGYSENGDFSTELSRLQNKTDGYMDDVHTARNTYGADCVVLIVNGSQYCGIAYLMTSVSDSFKKWAFSVTSRVCATGYYTFGHELGHNMGSNHDHGNASSGAYNYSFGWRTSNNQYRTVMAYSPGTRLKYFSNHNKSRNGYPLGQANYAENWRSLNNTASTVSNWRDTAGGGGGGALDLRHTNLIRGGNAVFITDGANAAERVWVAASLTTGSNCYSQLGGLCIDLGSPVHVLGSSVSDAQGSASITVHIPAILSVGTMVFAQSAVLRGVGGADSEKSNRTSGSVL
jgi:hypothetical protein